MVDRLWASDDEWREAAERARAEFTDEGWREWCERVEIRLNWEPPSPGWAPIPPPTLDNNQTTNPNTCSPAHTEPDTQPPTPPPHNDTTRPTA